MPAVGHTQRAGSIPAISTQRMAQHSQWVVVNAFYAALIIPDLKWQNYLTARKDELHIPAWAHAVGLAL